MNVSRERSFIRQSSAQHQINIDQLSQQQQQQKRRSFGHHQQQHPMSHANHHQQQLLQHGALPQTVSLQYQQMRGKPGIEIYRPPNTRSDGQPGKLNVNAQEFTMDSQNRHNGSDNFLQMSKSSGNLHYHFLNQSNGHQRHVAAGGAGGHKHNKSGGSGANILQATASRVKFAPHPPVYQSNSGVSQFSHNALQRSKSLSSADAIAMGVAGLGPILGEESQDAGTFSADVQTLLDKAVRDPNNLLSARNLMELAPTLLHRALEARRYALPVSRLCIAIIAREKTETFLEALLNTCRQWYQERDKVLGPAPHSKNPARPKYTAFMAFLTEMFCQLKRRQLQLKTECDGVPPPLLLLTVLLKCCEGCVQPTVRSIAEIECLFFVLTCIGRDLETHLPDQLECLLAAVRDAFLNSTVPVIRRTLLQLIELQASHWQLPGNTVLYYYPAP